VAIIDISGFLSNDAWWWDETDYRDIQKEVRLAVEDADVKGILLRINSPGGETDNAFETARILIEAGKQKPLWAVADVSAYSAGYLLAASAQRIYVSPVTGGIGSIGIFSVHYDFSKALEKAGVNVTLISAGKGKTDGNPFEPLSESAKKSIQAEVERLYEEFVGVVASQRGKSAEYVKGLGARLFNGAREAIASGLADRAGSLEQAWFDLATFVQEKSSPSFSVAAASATTSIPKEDTTVSETIKADAAQAPAVDLEAVKARALEEGYGQAAEIVELCALAGVPAKATEFISQKLTVAQTRKHLLALRAAEDEKHEIRSHVLPETGTSAQVDLDNNPVVRACEKLAAANKGWR
jgi:signal peptide peptidase SppA